MEDRAPTLLNDASAAAEHEDDEPEPLAEDRDVEPPTTPTPPQKRSKRLMKKKANAKAKVAEVATSKMIEQPRRKKASPARLTGPPAAPRRSPRLRSKSAAVGLQSEKATPSLSSTRRSTRARRKPIRFAP